MTGKTRPLPVFSQADGRTTIPLRFAPFGSWFILFRKPINGQSSSVATGKRNFADFSNLVEIAGAWTVHFDPAWGGPEQVEFPALADWAQHTDAGIRFYSGTARYEKHFAAPPAPQGKRVYLNLGNVRELAQVRLNGKDLGILWAMPFRVDVTDALATGDNHLEVEVVNFWPNRVIGDQSLPPDQRRTRTNVRKLTAQTALMPSGLLGPVALEVADE
jgi:hypothetical protein